MQVILVTLPCGLLLLACGGIGCWLALGRETFPQPPLDAFLRIVLGGLGLTILALFLGLDWCGPALFLVLPLIGLTGWLYLALRCHGQGARAWPRGLAWGGVAAALAIVGAHLATGWMTDLPWGYDPVFHSILARKIVNIQRLPIDWLPFEPISLNYPLGVHLLLAMAARWVRAPMPVLFQAFYPWVGLLELGMLYVVARRFLGEPRQALAAVLIQLCACQFGSYFSYLTWGGMPTLLGMALLLGVLAEFLADPPRPRGRWLAAILLAALAATHHLMLLIGALVLGVLLAGSLLRRTDRPRAGRMLVAGLLAAVLAAPSLFWYASHAGTLGQTQTLRFRDEPMYGPLLAAARLGWPALGLGALGLATWWHQRSRYQHTWFLAGWGLVLIAAFAGLDYGYRAWAQAAWGESVTAFTPSRFLTVATAPLAILGGSIVGGSSAWRRWGGWTLVVAACCVGVYSHAQAIVAQPRVGWSELEPWAQVQAQLPADAFVIVLLPPDTPGLNWSCYLLGSETFLSPIPASEQRDHPLVRAKVAVYDQLNASGDIGVVRPWISARGKRCFILTLRPAGQAVLPPFLELVAIKGRWALLELHAQPGG